jgi:hypothetical protein
MKTTSIRIIIWGLILLINQDCNRNKNIQSLDQYVKTIFNAVESNKFAELKPLLLELKDSSLFKDDIFSREMRERENITVYIADKEANNKYRALIKERLNILRQKFNRLDINQDSIKFELNRLRLISKTFDGTNRSSCDVVFNSCGKKYILVLTDILNSNGRFKNFNFETLDLYDSVFSYRHKQLMNLVPIIGPNVEEWNTSVYTDNYSSPYKLRDFVVMINNRTSHDFEGFTIKIILFDKRSGDNDPIYILSINRKMNLNHDERIQIKVPELEDFIIPKTVVINKSLDANFETVDLNYKNEFFVYD